MSVPQAQAGPQANRAVSFATNAVDIGKPNACALFPAPPVRTPIAIGRQGVQGNGLTGAGSGFCNAALGNATCDELSKNHSGADCIDYMAGHGTARHRSTSQPERKWEQEQQKSFGPTPQSRHTYDRLEGFESVE
uniref:Uncharacterized protein n=1 Tax=Anopheles coluzzii TaxID=1518534 RepID=A0A8W7PDG1_ANOCL